MAFIREHQSHRDGDGLRWGVESICTVLTEHGCAIAGSTYYEYLARTPSARARRDEQLKAEVTRVHEAHFGVYGARKVWLQLNREGIDVARCTVERLMRELGLRGAVRGKAKRTTLSDPAATRAADLVPRRFTPPAPNVLWGADSTYVSTWSGWVYVAFVIDVYSRMIVGWQASTRMRTSLVLDALELALWCRSRHGQDVDGRIHHSDAGSTPRSASPTGSPRLGPNRR